MSYYLEHANLSVDNAQATVDFLLAAIPTWRVRGSGDWDSPTGQTVDWYHIGDDKQYITVQSGGDGPAQDWTLKWTGVKHLGIAVPNLEEVIERLRQHGYELDHLGGEHPHRKSAYYLDGNNLQFEFIEYLSERADERNDYTL